MYEMNHFLNVLFRASIYPGLLLIPWLYGLISVTTIKVCLILFVILFIIGPIIFKNSISFQRKIFFLSFVLQDCDFKNPNAVGLYGTRNFAITFKDPDAEENIDEVKIGIWHILPIQITKKFTNELNLDDVAIENILNSTDIVDPNLDKIESIIKSEFNEINQENESKFYEKMLKQPGTIILYLHGNTGTRGKGHRVELYQVLRKLGYHVIAMDYRSFGDSEQISPSEQGCVQDALAVYNYIKEHSNNPVILWGHSLGTGVATHLLARLNQLGIYGPHACILESPFTNINDELKSYPMAFFFKYLPWFDYTIANPIYDNYLRFESDQHICEFRQPVLILHAEDDYVVPFNLGYKLYRRALDYRGRSWGPVQFERFSATLHYGHRFICRAPNLPDIVETFINNYKNAVF